MTATKKDPVLVVLQLSGGNDALNTVVPHGDPLYYDNRPSVRVPEGQALDLNGYVGLNPNMGAMKRLYDDGKLAVIQGVGYPNPNRSHFRSMDIWHTCEPDKQGTEGWLGRATREIDPHKENVLTAVNFGRGLPRALAAPGRSGCLGRQSGHLRRFDGDRRGRPAHRCAGHLLQDLLAYHRPQFGGGLSVADRHGRAEGRRHPEHGSRDVHLYGGVRRERGCAVHEEHRPGSPGRFRYAHPLHHCALQQLRHARWRAGRHGKLWTDTSNAIADFYDDLKEHDASDNVVVLVFTEFGRRVHDNGSGTDHGSGGMAFVVGDAVNGGLYGEYPSLEDDKLLEGDLHFSTDFRSIYTDLLEGFMGLDAQPLVNGTFEKFNLV